MKLLVVGGTLFLGRHVVEAALARGHEVTLFNRGSRPALFAGRVEQVQGNRNEAADLARLRGRAFDAAIDTCGYRPAQVEALAGVLGASVPHMVFVSSISVLASFPPRTPFDESAPMAAGDEGYGPLKARCEDALHAAWPGRAAVVRPGLIVGPHDPTGRFSYWPQRVADAADGEPVLAPGRPERPVQLIDARDLSAFCIDLAEQRRSGVFHAVDRPLPMAALLDACAAAAATRPTFVWRSDATLLRAGVAPWTGLPLWLPEDDAQHGGMLLGDNTRARSAGLACRPLVETARDTLAWLRAGGDGAPPSPARAVTIDRARERALLSADFNDQENAP